MKNFEDEFKEVVGKIVAKDVEFYKNKEQCPLCKEYREKEKIWTIHFRHGTTKVCESCVESVDNIITESMKHWLKSATYRKPFHFLAALRELMEDTGRFVEPLRDTVDDMMRDEVYKKGDKQ